MLFNALPEAVTFLTDKPVRLQLLSAQPDGPQDGRITFA